MVERKILIDTDPGIDDAMAILMALRSPELEIVGLTSIFGNTSIDFTSLNCKRILELEGNNHIPVAKGCGESLVIPTPELGTKVHGINGIADIDFPLPNGKLINKPAAQFIVDIILAHPGEITLVPIGPLTNIALAIKLEPKIIDLVKEVIIMGGAATVPGNMSPVAEANICHDPHAASIVFRAGWKLTMVGLDVTTKIIMDNQYLEELFKYKNLATNFIRQIIPCYQSFFDLTLGMGGSIHTHDPSAISYLLAPDLFTVQHIPVFVVCEGRCIGQTIPAYGNWWKDLPDIGICIGADEKGVLNLIKQNLILS